MSFGSPLKRVVRRNPRIRSSRVRKASGRVGGHVWAAMLGLTLLPMIGGIVVTFVLLVRAERRVSVGQTPETTAAAGDATLALVLAAVLALIVAMALVRYFLRPLEELADSRAQLEILYREAREDALHDGLTGLGNHRSFQDELARQVDLFHRRGVAFVLLLVDVDNLKAVNDSEGHAAGDAMLVNLAVTMREMFRGSDRLFRVGGDEFAVIMPTAELESAVAASDRLRHFSLRPPAGARPTSISGGISAVPRFAANRDQVYRQADAALYWAKRHGRATVEVFDPERDQLNDDVGGEGIANAVHDVIRGRQRLSAVYQPLVDLRSGRVLGFEGLVRPDPAGPLASAGRLFAAASATGWTVELDLACFGVVAAGARGLKKDSLLSFNLSSRTLELKHFDAAWLLDPIAQSGISPERVIVELTERDAIGDMRQLQRNMALLQQKGLRMAADDVGAGNAGLRLLSQVQFDFVKLDLSLVHEGVQRVAARAVLRSLRDLALRQESIVIAEGVETREQLQLVQELDFPVGQGYLLGRPAMSLEPVVVELPRVPSGVRGAAPVYQSRPSAPRGVSLAQDPAQGLRFGPDFPPQLSAG